MEKSIRIHPLDNVAVALTDLHAGETVAGITLREDVPAEVFFVAETAAPITGGSYVLR